jgi:chemotaxis protein methyltransferase CheR
MTTPGDCRGPAADYAFTDDDFEKIRSILMSERCFDPAIYKERYMRRRITIRIRATDCASAAEYRNFLADNDQELDRLLRVLTIHVSQFYRNRSTFDRLQEEILPQLFLRCAREGKNEVHFWSAGCAGGEEPYTLALVLREAFLPEMERYSLAISATDVDGEILEKARNGVYGLERLVEIPQGVMETYFTSVDGKRFVVSPDVRGMVEFRRGDLLDTGSYRKSELILCRNVLIYFERGQQEKILNAFAESLPEHGILVLGRSETLIGDIRKRFECVSPVERIYRKIG